MNIERNFHKFLYGLVTTQTPDNKLARTIAVNYRRLDKSSKEKFYESLAPAYKVFGDKPLEPIQFDQQSRFDSPDIAKDFRLKAIRIANVRGIPSPKDNL